MITSGSVSLNLKICVSCLCIHSYDSPFMFRLSLAGWKPPCYCKNKVRHKSGKKFNTHTLDLTQKLSNSLRKWLFICSHFLVVIWISQLGRKDTSNVFDWEKTFEKKIRLGWVSGCLVLKWTIIFCSCWACSDRHSTCAFINEALCAYLSRRSACNITHCRTTPFLRLWGEMSALTIFNKSWQHTAAEKQNKSYTLAEARPNDGMKRDQIYYICVCQVSFLMDDEVSSVAEQCLNGFRRHANLLNSTGEHRFQHSTCLTC